MCDNNNTHVYVPWWLHGFAHVNGESSSTHLSKPPSSSSTSLDDADLLLSASSAVLAVDASVFPVNLGTIVGSIGYVAFLKAVNATAVSSVVLLSPLVGTAVAWFLKQEPAPAWTTLAGFTFVCMGTLMILLSSSLNRVTKTLKVKL